MATRVRVQKPTADAFRRYGKLVMVKPDRKPFVDNPNLTYWDKVVEFEPGITRTIGVMTVKKRPMVLVEMERHHKALEWFVPLAGASVACFAECRDPDDSHETPEPRAVVAYLMENIAGFVVDRGVWHWPAFPMGETAVQLVDLRRDTENDDVDTKKLPEPIEIFL